MAQNDIRALKENAEATFDEVVLSAADLKLGTTSGLPVKTGTGGVLEAGAFGSAAGQFAEGNHTHSSLYDATNAQNGVTVDNFSLTLVGELGSAVIATDNLDGTTKTLTLPNDSGTLELQGHTHTSANITDLKTAGDAAGLWDNANSVRGATVSDYTLTVTNGANTSALTFPPGASRVYDLPNASGTLALTTTAPASHTHGNLTNAGAIGSTSGLPVVTTTSGAITTLALGSAGQVLKVNAGGTAVEFGAAGFGEVRSDASGVYTYMGLATANTADSASSWTIRRSEFSTAGTYVSTKTATNVKWDDRLTASYT